MNSSQSVLIKTGSIMPLTVCYTTYPIRQGQISLLREDCSDDEVTIDQSVGYANAWEAPAGKVTILRSDIPELIRVLQEVYKK